MGPIRGREEAPPGDRCGEQGENEARLEAPAEEEVREVWRLGRDGAVGGDGAGREAGQRGGPDGRDGRDGREAAATGSDEVHGRIVPRRTGGVAGATLGPRRTGGLAGATPGPRPAPPPAP